MNELQIKLQLDDNQPAHWFDVETINFDDEVCFTDWVGEHIEIEYQGEPLRIKPPSLNDDQQVVLEWWVKKLNEEGEDADPLGVICAMQSYGLREEKIYDAAVNLTPAQQYQVLAAFAEWGQAVPQ